MSPAEWFALAVTVLTTLGLREVAQKVVNRKANQVANHYVEVQTAQTEVETVKTVLDQFRDLDRMKTDRLQALERRVESLEARDADRTMKLGMHNAWAQVAHQTLLITIPDYPPPPPLSPPTGTTA